MSQIGCRSFFVRTDISVKRVMLYFALSLAAGILLRSIESAEAATDISVIFLIFLIFCIFRKKYSAVVLCTFVAALGFLYMGLYADIKLHIFQCGLEGD